MLMGIENHGGMQEILSDSTELDREFDIIAELKDTVDELDEINGNIEVKNLKEKVFYLGFLIRELEDNLSGEYEQLRYRRFISEMNSVEEE